MGDGEYGSTTEVKEMLGIFSTDTVDDAIIARYVLRGNRQVDNDLAGFIETLEVASASITDDLKSASNHWASRLYSQFRQTFERADQFQETYKDTIQGVKTRLTSIPTVKTSIRSATKAYVTEPLKSDPLLE